MSDEEFEFEDVDMADEEDEEEADKQKHRYYYEEVAEEAGCSIMKEGKIAEEFRMKEDCNIVEQDDGHIFEHSILKF